jgi:hypothetical protein
MRSSVVESCLFSPFTRVCTLSVLGSFDFGTAIGPCSELKRLPKVGVLYSP